MKTSKGYSIAWLVKYTYSVQGFEGYSGRVRLAADDPSRDVVVRWDNSYQPVNHDYGRLIRATGTSRVGRPSGFDNIFKDLR